MRWGGMWMYEEMIGKQYGNWTVISYSHSVDNSKFRKDKNAFVKDVRHYMLVECICGTVRSVRKDGLTSGSTKSCGCTNRRNSTHNLSKTKLYYTYQGIKRRCYNSKSEQFKNYGGRGIKMCDEWLNDSESFFEWSKRNGFSEELSIDRINNDGDYSPENCRWVDMRTQSRNKRTNVHVTYKGKTQLLVDWAKEKGMNRGTLSSRLNSGWTLEDALETPVGAER